MIQMLSFLLLVGGYFAVFVPTAEAEYIDGMSQYRAYFVPGNVDPSGLCGGVEKCRVASGPTYTPSGKFTVNFDGSKSLESFSMMMSSNAGNDQTYEGATRKTVKKFFQSASFIDDPVQGYSSKCCVVSQNIKTGVNGNWEEDSQRRNGNPNIRYGHREHPARANTGYYDQPDGAGEANQLTGAYYYGNDEPAVGRDTSSTWFFQLVVLDVCQDTLVQAEGTSVALLQIDWSKTKKLKNHIDLQIDLEALNFELSPSERKSLETP